MKKSLKDISWDVTEEVYRADPALSYSTLSRYERGGFHEVPKLFDKIESPSLTFGSAVDAIITGGMQEFNSRFLVCDYTITDGGINVCNKVIELYRDEYENFSDIPQDKVSEAAKSAGFWKDSKWDKKRYSEVLKTGNVEEYYKVLRHADKTVLDRRTYDDVVAAVNALKSSLATKWYFEVDNPFDEIERFYQLKFKATFDGINYRCMMDECIVDHKIKLIYPIDLKTSSHWEDEFYKSFVDWNYNIQARLYSRILEDNLKRDEYFKDFKILDYRFLVVNRRTLMPLVWEFPDTKKFGTLTYGAQNQIRMRDPFEIGKEVHTYLESEHKVPVGVDMNYANNLIPFLEKL